jgi:hypothetical protein
MFDWQDYYLLARQMLLQADSASYKEAVFRTAVSRAYYAAYHFACDYRRTSFHLYLVQISHLLFRSGSD